MNLPEPELFFRILQRPDDACSLTSQQWENIIHVFRDARILGAFEERAAATGALQTYPEFAHRHLRAMRIYADRQAQQVKYECTGLHRTLSPVCGPPIFLKGAAYTLTGSRNSRGRIYSDIDILVEKSALDAAQRQLETQGWRAKEVNDYDDRYYREWTHEIPPMWHLASGTVIDLHHNILPPVSGRAPNAEILLRETQTLPNGLCVLTHEAQVLHAVVHLFVNDDISYGFRDLFDLWLMISDLETPDSFSRLREFAKETGFEKELWYALRCIEARFTLPDAFWESTLAPPASLTPGRDWVQKYVLTPALVPGNKLSWNQRFAKSMAYTRGHVLKMPLPILIKHTSSKLWSALRDVIFGKYQFEAD